MYDSNLTDTLRGLSSCAYESFGAHPSFEYGQNGVRFTVYAPNARHASLIGSFNQWNGYDMFREENGIWSIFVAQPSFESLEGSLYKYRITTANGEIFDRIDPFAFESELRPNTASVVCFLKDNRWHDDEWMSQRGKNFSSPMNIYELHAGSWKRPENGKEFYNYLELGQLLIPYLKSHGYTHVEFLPLTEHPLDASWGYQSTGYYSVTSRYGTPQQLMELVNLLHQNGIGVILDFVPAHFVTDFYALHQYDGGFLYESCQPELRYSPWGTALFDFSKPYVLSFLISCLDFWVRYFHIDGIRYDAVSNLIYREGCAEKGLNDSGIWFLKSANYIMQQKYPDVMLIAEDSSNYLKVTAPVVYGGLGFDYKWAMGWMHDILDYLSLPPNQRCFHHHLLTLSISYFYQEHYLLPFSHDEVVHGKKTIIDKLWGNYEEKFSQLRTLYLYMFTHPGKKLNFMGNELAEFREWDESKELGWNLLSYPAHSSFILFWKALGQLYLSHPCLSQWDYHSDGFRWIDCNRSDLQLLSYQRIAPDGKKLLVILHFSSQFLPVYSLHAEHPGPYQVIFSTEQSEYGGSGIQYPFLKARKSGGEYEITLPMAPYSGVILELADSEKDCQV